VIATPTSDTGGNASSWALTENTGYYEISSGLSTGTYTVKAANYAFLQKGETALYVPLALPSIKVTAGKETVNTDFNIVASGWISGKVTTTTGMPLFRAKVVATKSDGTDSGFEYTDIEGKYTITNGLSSGTYTVTATYQTYTSSKSNIVATEGGMETPNIDFQLTVSASGQIVGRVSDATTKNPIFGAPVKISGTSTTTVTTDEKGYYSYLATAGSYTVTAMVAGYRNNASTVSVAVDQIKDIYYPGPGSLGFQIQKYSGSSTGTITGTITGESNPIPEFPVAAVPVIFSLTILTLLLVSRRIRRNKTEA